MPESQPKKKIVKKSLSRPKKPEVPVEPEHYKPYKIEFTVLFNKHAWRKVHPPHLAGALAAAEAALRTHLESIQPHPYAVAEIESRATYGNVLWDSWDEEVEDFDDED